jgi:sugar lactone lactonase YvrE
LSNPEQSVVLMAIELVDTVAVANVLGEGVLWNARQRSVWWTDIESSLLFEYDPNTNRLRSWDTPFRVACFGITEDRARLIVAFEHGIAFYDYATNNVEWLVAPGTLEEGLRFNDGKIDPAGRFWVGSMVEDTNVATTRGSLYCLDFNTGLLQRISGISISNGLCWSPDGSVMYHADSAEHRIDAYDFDPVSGTVSGRRTFARTSSGVHPDGSTVDREGSLWNAQWGGASVVRYRKDGQVDLTLELPVSQPTCVAFGGDDLELLFVTSARADLSDEALANEPAAGDLFIYRTDCNGLPAPSLSRSFVKNQ